MEIRELKNNEDLYIYKNSMQISQQTGLIGHLRGDFGNNGNEFWTTWWDFRKDRKTEEFKSELDAVINILRKDDNILFNLDSMKAFCRDKRLRINPYGDNRSYGIRVDTEMYAYLIKLTPYPDDYNFYCYCYIKDYLDSHIEKASGGIRFIDSCYNDKFILPDGGKIKLVYSDSREQEKMCRYIDSCHLEVGSELYHICEFAERTERAGITIVPISEEEEL